MVYPTVLFLPTSPTTTIPLSPRLAISVMVISDLDQVVAIERGSFPSPWTKDGFLVSIKAPFGQAWVLLDREPDGRTVVGYLCFWEHSDHIQVVNICVAHPKRGQGWGRLMMEFAIAWAGLRNKKKVSLEVRPSNHQARSLYRSLGFRKTGMRAGYYTDTGEDALLLELSLEPNTGSKTV